MITKKQLDSIERFADKLWGKVGLDVEFTRHFLDRLNDSRNKKDITPAEIQRLFKQSYRRYGKKIASLGQGAQAVINDMETDINMPFVLQLDKNGELDLVAKTVMRKKDFKTTNQKFTVESGAGEEGTKQLSYKYRKDTPKQSINGKTESNMKRQNFIPKAIIDEDVPAFMGALAQAAKDGKKEFEFGGKTFKVKLKKDVVDKITKNMDESEDLDDLFIDGIISDLVEAAAADYAKLSDSDLKDLFDIFKNVGRSAAKPVILAIKREMQKRSMKEDIDLEEDSFDKLAKKLGRINPETLGDVLKGKIKLSPAERKEFDAFMKGARKMFASESTDLEEADGWIAIFKGKKLEITKKDAKDLWGAKQFAINKLKVPKSKQGLLAIKPAYNESNDLEEATELEEAVKWWTVTITKKTGKLFKGQTVDVKASNSAQAIKKGLKQMKADPMTVPSGSVDAVLGESVDLEEAVKWWTVTITKKTGKLFKGQTVDVKASNSAQAIKKGLKQMKADPMTVPSGSVDAVLGESVDLEEATLPFKELEKAWIRTKGNQKRREKLIKKHNLKPLISKVRPGAIKLGPLNNLKMKTGNYTMAGLDADGELIFVTNNPLKIRYPSNIKDRPKGEEMKESVSLETLRLRKVIQLSVNESDEKLIDSFIAESNVDISWAPSKIVKTFNKFTREL